MIAFRLSMPGVGSWNGRWSGEGREYVKVVSLGRSKKAEAHEDEIVTGGYYYYSFGDSWSAAVTATLITPVEARRLRRVSMGFCGYDWMVDEIIEHGRILTLSERADLTATSATEAERRLPDSGLLVQDRTTE